MGSILMVLQEKYKDTSPTQTQKAVQRLGWAKAWSVLHLGRGYYGDPGVEVRSESRLHSCHSVCLDWSEGQAAGRTWSHEDGAGWVCAALLSSGCSDGLREIINGVRMSARAPGMDEHLPLLIPISGCWSSSWKMKSRAGVLSVLVAQARTC